jgi:hypothetical protein
MWCYVAAKLVCTILKVRNKIEHVLEQHTEEDVWSSGKGSNMGIEKIS